MEARNELRRKSQLLPLDVEEIERQREEKRAAAYRAVFDAQVGPHTRHLESAKPKGWSEAQGLQGRHLPIKNGLKPETDRLWAEKLQDGSWREWIEKQPS